VIARVMAQVMAQVMAMGLGLQAHKPCPIAMPATLASQ